MKKIFTLIISVLLFMSFTSCSKHPAEEPVNKMMECIFNEDVQLITSYVDSFTYEVPSLPDILKDELRKNCTYSVGEITKEKKTEFVSITITSFSAKNTLASAEDKISIVSLKMAGEKLTDKYSEEILSAYKDAINENIGTKTAVTLTIPVRKLGKNKVCIIGEELSAQLMNAIYGQ